MHECMGQNAQSTSLAFIQGLHTLTPDTGLTNVGPASGLRSPQVTEDRGQGKLLVEGTQLTGKETRL